MECQLEALRKCLTVSSVRHALCNLPPTLDATYERILINIPQEYRREAHCTLQLLTVSRRPLKLHEVAEAVAIDPEREIFDPENRLRDPEALLEICSSLLILSGYVTHLPLLIALGTNYDLHIILYTNILFLAVFHNGRLTISGLLNKKRIDFTPEFY